MSLLLMSKAAEKPFYCDKLNIRLYSGEELCWCICHYPLLAVDGLLTDDLIRWIGKELKAETFAQELAAGKRAGEPEENLLLKILQANNYCTLEEIRSFRNRILACRKLPKAQLLRETGKAYFHAGRLTPAEEKLQQAVKELTVSLIGAKTAEQARQINDEKADVLCDLVAVRMLRFDRAGAMKLLDLAEETGRTRRAQEYRYLISGLGLLSDEEKAALDEKRRSLKAAAQESAECTRIRELSGLDNETAMTEAGRIVKEWKKEYRRTG